jgi:trehalose-6-phosphate synthase
VQADAAQLREELGKDRFVFLGVDRLDYTKGIDRRVQAYGELIERGELGVDDSVLVQTAVPSREHVAEYQELRDEVELLVGRINGEHSRIGRNAVHYLHRNLPVERLVAFYLAADAMLVTPLRDGMNLVCKEFVASRVWDDGVLVLSEFTGAAHELRGSLLVNPHDIDGLAETMLAATRLQPGEVRRRMRSLRRIVRANDVHRWARTFLDDLAG